MGVGFLDNLAKSGVKAVIVHVDSPGGTTAGAEQLHKALRRVVASKPTVMVVDGLAASGAYIAAIAGDHVIAQDTSLVGSIGVLFQYPNFSDLLRTVGVKVEEVKSSPLKAAPNGFEPTSPEARAALETPSTSLREITFALFSANPMLPKSPALDAYVKRCTERPAYARAGARDNG